MKLAEKIKPYISRHNRHIYFMAFICFGITLAKPNFLFHAEYEKSATETALSNPNVLKADEIKKLSALMKTNGKQPYKILPLPTSTETKVAKLANSRCNYNGQDYLLGDIVKTTQGWIRCTPTIIFNTERAGNIPGSPAWTTVQ